LLVVELKIAEERHSDAVPSLYAPCPHKSPTDDAYAPRLPNRNIFEFVSITSSAAQGKTNLE